MALTETAGAAYVTSDTGAVTTGSYTPTSGALQVAIVGVGNGGGLTFVSATLTDTSGSGSWTLLVSETNQTTNTGLAFVYVRDAWSGAATVAFAVTVAGGTADGVSIITRQFAGAAAAASQSGVTAIADASNTHLSITPGTTGSQCVGGFGTSSGAKTLTANATTSIYGKYSAGPNGDTSACIEAASLSTGGTAISMGFTNTAATNAFALAEIQPGVAVVTTPAGVYLRQAIGAASLW
jgi:hypothetical protein